MNIDFQVPFGFHLAVVESDACKGKDELWWYIYGDPVKHPLETGSYFGRWCIEAIAAVKAFETDDRLCLGHEYYPGDLLWSDGSSTHTLHFSLEQPTGFWGRLLGKLKCS